MSAQIIQFRDYQNPKDLARMYQEPELYALANDIFQQAMLGGPLELGLPDHIHTTDKEPA